MGAEGSKTRMGRVAKDNTSGSRCLIPLWSTGGRCQLKPHALSIPTGGWGNLRSLEKAPDAKHCCGLLRWLILLLAHPLHLGGVVFGQPAKRRWHENSG